MMRCDYCPFRAKKQILNCGKGSAFSNREQPQEAIMLTKLYIAVWGMWALLGFGGAAAGMMNGYPLVYFGMAAFGLIYFGMMFVLPLTVAHPEVNGAENLVEAPIHTENTAADRRPEFCVNVPRHV